MQGRAVSVLLYLSDRLWVLFVAMIALASIKAAAAATAPVSHPERVIVRLN
jgi:hypothetical protein